MKFPYRQIGSRRARPFIPIKIRNPKSGKEVPCYALVDSGADCNLFAPVLGEILGLDVARGEERPISGVVAGERRVYFEHDLEIEVSGWRFRSKVGFMPGIASNAGEGIVGQSGFFDHFRFVKFDKRKGFVELGGFVDEASAEE